MSLQKKLLQFRSSAFLQSPLPNYFLLPQRFLSLLTLYAVIPYLHSNLSRPIWNFQNARERGVACTLTGGGQEVAEHGGELEEEEEDPEEPDDDRLGGHAGQLGVLVADLE